MATDTSQRKATKSTQVGAPPPGPEHLPCPRCDSTNTKFCYYNNYNFSQPRHFCKSCRRYWTHGGTLRDIPVGGGSRKNTKRYRTASSTSSTSSNTSAAFAASQSDFRYFPAADHGGAVPFMSGSFTSLLNSPGAGLLALGGFGLVDDVGFGLGRAVWQFPAVAEGGPANGNDGGASMAGHTWQLESNGDGGFVGGGDCFTLPDLAISTPGIFMK